MMISLSFLWLVMVVLIIGIGGGLWWGWRQRSRRPPQATIDTPRQPSIFDLAIGDIVQYLGQDWVVEGQLVYQEDGFTWMEYMLQDGSDIRWLGTCGLIVSRAAARQIEAL